MSLHAQAMFNGATTPPNGGGGVTIQVACQSASGVISGGANQPAITAQIACDGTGSSGLTANYAIGFVVACNITSPGTTCPHFGVPSAVTDISTSTTFPLIGTTTATGTTTTGTLIGIYGGPFTPANVGAGLTQWQATHLDYGVLGMLGLTISGSPTNDGAGAGAVGAFALTTPSITPSAIGEIALLVGSDEVTGATLNTTVSGFTNFNATAQGNGQNFGAYAWYQILLSASAISPTVNAGANSPTGGVRIQLFK
jgi:hypothetical protein